MAEIVYIGDYENTIDLRLDSEEAGVSGPISMPDVTQITANISGIDVVSTNQGGDAIRWNQVGYASGEIRCRFGDVAGLYPGNHLCWFIVVDPTNPDGVVFGPITLTCVALP